MTGLVDIVEVDANAAALLAALHAASFCRPGDETWTVKSFADVLGMTGTFCLLARRELESGSEPVGFAACRVAADDSELLSLGVIPGYRHAGTARALVVRSMEICRKAGALTLTLEVATDNPSAKQLYESMGFAAIGRRPAYYRRLRDQRVDAITMRRQLG
ncbi:MAG: GNAT family N-acetyltransferase [Alphaproteobacteria bacterium]